MLIYDGEMSKFFEYTEVDIEKGNTRKEVFRLVELREVIRCDWKTCLYKYALAMTRYVVVRRYIKRSS